MGTYIATTIQVGLILAFAALAMRLSWPAPRRGRGPELLVSAFFLGIAFELACYAIDAGPQGLATGISVTLSSVALMAFVRTVFRPEQVWALYLFGLLSIAIGSVFIVPHVLGNGSTPLGVRLAWSALRGAALIWAVVECTIYYRQMRRRVALGIADPIVANRFLLWSLWTGGTAMLPITGLGLRLLSLAGLVPDYTETRDPTLGAFIFAAILFSSLAVAATALWLSFFPPGFFRRWISSRAALQAA